MSRHHCIPGAIILGLAFVLSLLVSISLPYVRAFDVVRVTVEGAVGAGGAGNGAEQLSQVRWGIWGHCHQLATSGVWECASTGYGYAVNISGETIGASWTRGLVLHPIATGIILIAWCLSFSQHLTVTLIASLASFLGAFFTLIAFAVDIALFAYVKGKMNNIPNVPEKTAPGPAFWMTLVVLFLTLIAGCTVCFGRRRDRAHGNDSYKITTGQPWYHKFLRRR